MSRSHNISISVAEVSFAFFYVVLVAILHLSNLKQLVGVDWGRNDFDYCYLIPIIVVYLLFKKRFYLFNEGSKPSWFGLFPIILGCMFLLFGELGGEYLVSYLSLWLMIVGYFWLIWGWPKLRLVIFPFFFLLTMFPPPSYIYSRLTLHMQLLSSWIAEHFLHILGVPAYREGNVIDIGITKIQVVAACSGLRYLIPMLIVGLLMGYIMNSRAMWRKVFIFLVALPIAIFMNGVRLALTGLLTREYGPWIVEGMYHDMLGWGVFFISICILFFLMHFLEKSTKEDREESRSNISIPVTFSYSFPERWNAFFCLRPLVALFMVGAMVVFLHYGHHASGTLPAVSSMEYFPKKIGDWKGIRSNISQNILSDLDISDYVLMDYVDLSGKNINFYVAYYTSQSKGESIHSPETCMVGGGWRFVDSKVQKIFNGITVNRSVLVNEKKKIVSYFWFPCRGRTLTNAIELKMYNFWDSLTKGRTDGALVRVITDVVGEDVQAADKRILGFLESALPVLHAYLPNK